MATQTKVPPKAEVLERDLVYDMAETVGAHGYKVASHTVKVDHEREESKLTVTFVRSNSNQGIIELVDDEDGDRDN